MLIRSKCTRSYIQWTRGSDGVKKKTITRGSDGIKKQSDSLLKETPGEKWSDWF